VTTPSPDERLEQLHRAIDGYPRRVAELSQRAAEVGAQTVIGEAGDGQVVVTLTGRGEVQGVRLTYRALRELDNRTLADRVMAAVNDGLDRAEALIGEADSADRGEEADEAVAQFERRMDDLLYELDYTDRKLDRLDD
jgi:DNA-binding protein YbaB